MKILLLDQIAKINYKYSYSLANALIKKGCDVTIAADLKKDNEYCKCPVINLFSTDEKNIGKISKLINYFKSYQKISKMVKQDKYDVIHTQWTIFSPLDYLFLKRIKRHNNITLTVTIHDILPFNQKFYDFKFHRKIYTLADHIIVQADNNIQRFHELFPELSGKEKMIPHGHFLDFGEPASKEESREYLSIPKDKLVFLFFGQIKKVKGVGVLLNAFAKIHSSNPDAMLIIAGNVWKDDFSQYQKIIDENNLSDCVRTDIKYIPDEDIKYYYSAADCCALPYLDVYQSGVVQLTYAYKKPVVATNIGAFKEVVIDNVSGFMCEPDNADSLADALTKAIQNKERFAEMGQAGYDYIAEKFSWDKIADETFSLYNN